MMKKIAVFNNKGGVGKSTIAANLSHGLAKLGYKVLLVDLDGQNDSSLFLGISPDKYKKTLFHLFDKRNPATLEECIIPARENLDLLPNSQIEDIDAEFHRQARMEIIMEEKLSPAADLGYDYMIIDCGPSRTRINDAVLIYIDHIVMPVQVEAASVRACGSIYEYLSDLRVPTSKILMVIPNMYDQRTNDARENLAFLNQIFAEDDLITPPIGRRVKVTESGKLGLTAFEYDNEAAAQFFVILEWMVKKIG